MYVDITKEKGGVKHFLNPWTIREIWVDNKNGVWCVNMDMGEEKPRVMKFKNQEMAIDFMTHFE